MIHYYLDTTNIFVMVSGNFVYIYLVILNLLYLVNKNLHTSTFANNFIVSERIMYSTETIVYQNRTIKFKK